MKRIFVLSLLLMSFQLKAQEKYFLISSSSDSEIAYEEAVKSNDFLMINLESGEISGVFSGGNFSGIFETIRTSSGFVKGFNYTMALGYLQRDVPSNKAFDELTMNLARGTKFYFYPDMLGAPQWHFLEISGSDSSKISLVRRH